VFDGHGFAENAEEVIARRDMFTLNGVFFLLVKRSVMDSRCWSVV
jgi:hypothetical protein